MRLLDFFFASRPLLQLPIWTVYLVSLHYHHTLSGGSFDWLDLALMVGLSLLFTAASYINQIFDQESDRVNGKVLFLDRGILSRSHLAIGFVLAELAAMVVVPFTSLFILFLFAQLLLLAFVYSAPPLRLKDRPFGGLFANGWAHGFLVSLAVMPEINIHNAGLLGWDCPIYFFFAVGSSYLLTTIPDVEGDATTGKKTMAVRFGRKGAMVIALVMVVIAALVAYRSELAALFYIAVLAGFFTLAAFVLRTDAVVRFVAKMPLLVLTLIAGYYYWPYLLFVVALLIATRAYYFKRFGVVYPELS